MPRESPVYGVYVDIVTFFHPLVISSLLFVSPTANLSHFNQWLTCLMYLNVLLAVMMQQSWNMHFPWQVKSQFICEIQPSQNFINVPSASKSTIFLSVEYFQSKPIYIIGSLQKLIQCHAIKAKTEFQYIFVLFSDLNTGFTSVRNNFYNVYSASDISKICGKIFGGEANHKVPKFRY